MKKLCMLSLIATVLLFSCQKDNEEILTSQQTKVDMSDFHLSTENEDPLTTEKTRNNCGTMHYLNERLKEDPNLYQSIYNAEYNSRKVLLENKKSNNRIESSLITIPVIVHVVYNSNEQNISEAQIRSQINVLNKDFSATNKDRNKAPSIFKNRIGNPNMKFVLERIIRKKTSKTSFKNNYIKRNNRGGSNVIEPKKYLNIWVSKLSGGDLGFASFPGEKSINDGVVIDFRYFGTNGTAKAPFNLGRTTTHEIGHWANLRHIWADSRKCNRDDFVNDTPNSNRPNYDCPSFPTKHCNSIDMTMNFMDYVDDRCMYMFTKGQVNRMRAIFARGGARAAMAGN